MASILVDQIVIGQGNKYGLHRKGSEGSNYPHSIGLLLPEVVPHAMGEIRRAFHFYNVDLLPARKVEEARNHV